MTPIRNRDLFRLFKVAYRDNLNKPGVSLVWAHRMSDALAIVNEHVNTTPRRFVMAVTGITELRTPDTDTDDYAELAWVDGTEPAWP